MKSKKSAFAHSSTGYGKQKHHKGHGHTHSNNQKDKSESKKEPKPNLDAEKEEDKDLNSGFGDYLRTPEAFEMMKLFVFANTIMLIVTMAWPHVKQQFVWLNEWWANYEHYQ
ncbi:uncharacterized protein Dwil_GK22804, isoform A [Drosophila willistoni]|uniref:CG4468-PA n=1 Tax=Drosophila willistoni TaxID=7260 RepID=Q8I176_DROWI|nr:uncharacterized protein LOC6649743 isoform X1 [Drosophila willistoni]AAO01092.1 CG4468-PA [Drosophila willistoni]EDW83350.1 uncharacterized protein Dwil_GK22804, isoform A [Drosophila willistoni]